MTLQTVKADAIGARKHADPVKFSDPDFTVKSQPRAKVPFERYDTVWFNTGTLCNIECVNCYIDSSPKNDQLVYLSRAEVLRFLQEATQFSDKPSQIGFTGGEPFMNPDLLAMLEDSLSLGYRVLVLTNAMRPMQRFQDKLLALGGRFPNRLALRVSLDHFEQEGHEAIRGPHTWQRALDGLVWLGENGFDVSVAARKARTVDEPEARRGYDRLFSDLGLRIDANDPSRLVLFPEMAADDDVVEISEGCWDILGMKPQQVMCASSRMVLKRKGSAEPTVVACTLIPYAAAFEVGATLEEARTTVTLNHRHCSRFCVLGKASCRVDG
ncbi:radical SAM protein [Hyphomicrobium sp.]|uniref:radical SAM protein n=1 Tax=Hyphomicrobium sp. TaxID=82 RepID=UPI003F6EE55D